MSYSVKYFDCMNAKSLYSEYSRWLLEDNKVEIISTNAFTDKVRYYMFVTYKI